ncbi:hypothetical protein H0X48_05300 [Candidatus Dependentiae bacterium]|nr:hypothetical protein [Candidatus Dependentiae bacterium]
MIVKKSRLFFYVLIVLSLISSLYGHLLCISKNQAWLVEDLKSKKDIPNRFRTFTDTKASGSSQFTGSGAQYIKKNIPAGYSITIIDLRKEPHGFLNNEPISWYGHHNLINAGLTPRQVEQDQKKRLAAVGRKQSVSVCILCKDEVNKGPTSLPCVCKNKPVHLVQSEEELVRKNGMNYKRFYIQDGHAPNDSQVDDFIRYAKSLPKNTWLHMHCRAGIGRTTTFLVMYDILRNCSKASLKTIIEKHALHGGINLLSKDNMNAKWKVAPLTERIAFIQKFYTYCKQALPKGLSWSTWKKQVSSTKKNSI